MPRCGISCPHPQITGQVSGQAHAVPRGVPKGVSLERRDQAVLLDVVFTTAPTPIRYMCSQAFLVSAIFQKMQRLSRLMCSPAS